MHALPGEDWTFFGKHQHRFEPPDLYFVRTIGDVSADDTLTQIDALQSLWKRTGHSLFWLADVRKMGAFMPEARRVMAQASKTDVREALRGSAVFGAAFSTRVVITLLVRSVRLLNPSKLRPLAFVETEDEARVFLVQHGQGKTSRISSEVGISLP